jgi:hypothetical protein
LDRELEEVAMFIQRMEDDVVMRPRDVVAAIILLIAMIASFAAALIFMQATSANRVHNVVPNSGYSIVG